jgi:RNA recognition motif-containing protein
MSNPINVPDFNNLIISDIVTGIVEKVVSIAEDSTVMESPTNFVFNFDDNGSLFSQHYNNQEERDWDEAGALGFEDTDEAHVSRNLMNEFMTIGIPTGPAFNTSLRQRLTSPLSNTEINLSFSEQTPVNISDNPSASSAPAAPPPPSTVDIGSEETQEEKDIAESLREVMAIVFEHKDTMGSGDFLDATNLLKKVYEAKDPRKLKDDIKEFKKSYEELYDEYREQLREAETTEKYYSRRVSDLSQSQIQLKKENKQQIKIIVLGKKQQMILQEEVEHLDALEKDYIKVNDNLWKTKFYYQNKLLKLSKEHPEVLSKQEMKEITTIKKRKTLEDSTAVLDTLSPVKVNLTMKNGKCLMGLDIQEPDDQLETLFAEETEEGEVKIVKTLDPIIVVENIPIINKEMCKQLCNYITNKRTSLRLWGVRPREINICLDSDTGKTTGKAYITFNTPKEASIAVRKSNGQNFDKVHNLKTYIKI